MAQLVPPSPNSCCPSFSPAVCTPRVPAGHLPGACCASRPRCRAPTLPEVAGNTSAAPRLAAVASEGGSAARSAAAWPGSLSLSRKAVV